MNEQMELIGELAARVQNGAAYLDKLDAEEGHTVPWWSTVRINLDILDMDLCTHCVIGQAVFDRSPAAQYWFRDDLRSDRWLGEHGFDLTPEQYGEPKSEPERAFTALEMAWAELVEARREGAE